MTTKVRSELPISIKEDPLGVLIPTGFFHSYPDGYCRHPLSPVLISILTQNPECLGGGELQNPDSRSN